MAYTYQGSSYSNFGKGTGAKPGGKNDAVLRGRSKATKGGREVEDRDVSLAVARSKAAEEQASDAERNKLLAAQRTLASLNADAQAKGSPVRYSLTQSESGELQISKNTVVARNTGSVRTVAQSASGVQQIPGLQSQSGNTLSQPSTTVNTIEPYTPYQKQSFLQRTTEGNPEVAIAEQRQRGNNVGYFLGSAAGELKDIGVGVGTFVSNRVLNSLQPVNPDAVAIAKGFKAVYNNPVGTAATVGTAVYEFVPATADSIRRDPVGSAGKGVAQIVAFEAGGAALEAAGKAPKVTSVLETASKNVKIGDVAVETVTTRGSSTAVTRFGRVTDLDVEATTVSPSLQVSKPSANAAGISLQEQYTQFSVKGKDFTGTGSLRAELEVKQVGKKSTGSGSYAGTVTGLNGGKVLDVGGELKTYTQPFRDIRVVDKPDAVNFVAKDLGIKELQFPFKEVQRGQASVAELNVFENAISKRKGASISLEESAVKLETNKYFRQADTQPIKETFFKGVKVEGRAFTKLSDDFVADSTVTFSKPEISVSAERAITPLSREVFASKSYPVPELSGKKLGGISDVTYFNEQVKGDGFVINEPVSVGRYRHVEFSENVGATISKGGTTDKVVKVFDTKPIDTKAFIDLNKGLRLKGADGYVLVEGENVLRGNNAGVGVKSNLFSGELKDFGSSGSVLKSPSIASVKPIVVSAAPSVEAQVKNVAQSVVLDASKSQFRSDVAKVSFGAGAGFSLTTLTSSPAPLSQNTSVKTESKVSIDATKFGVLGDADVAFLTANRKNPDFKFEYKPVQTRQPKNNVRTNSVVDLDFSSDVVSKPKQELFSFQDVSEKPKQDIVTIQKPQVRNRINGFLVNTPLVPEVKPFFYIKEEDRGNLPDFFVTVGSSGNKYYFNLGKGSDELVRKAGSLARNTAAARVTVVPLTAQAKRVDVQGLLGSDFRKNKQGDYIQSNKTRIGTTGEKQQIPGASNKRLTKGSTFGKALKENRKGTPLRALRKRLL